MSVQALTWAFKQEITPAGLKFVLVALANYASEDGYCYPSQKTLGRLTGQTDRSVRTHLVLLETLGLIQRETRIKADGGLTSDGYYLLFDPPEDSSGGGHRVAEESSTPPGNGFLSPRKETADPPEESSANTKELNTKEETKEETKACVPSFDLPTCESDNLIRARRQSEEGRERRRLDRIAAAAR
jgi:hypothetical protein